MGLKEIMNREKVVRREIAGVGVVYIRRVTTAEVLAMPDRGFSKNMIVAAVLDEEQNRVFETVQQVEALEYWLFRALQDDVLDVNGIPKVQGGGGQETGNAATTPPGSTPPAVSAVP